ncbi:hypothetical protein LJB42_004706 [Komagataella kurtzmanii]|nr:hypothetical protein LJB42_004706 [Komagataella kurtzmanii]
MTQSEPEPKKRKTALPDHSKAAHVKWLPKRVHTSAVVPRHPLGVKPSGNLLLASHDSNYPDKSQRRGFWTLMASNEQLMTRILQFIDFPLDLMKLGHTSRMMYAYTWNEELWRQLYMHKAAKSVESHYPLGIKEWKGSWRRTLLGIERDQEALIQVKENQICSDLLYRPYQCSQIDYSEICRETIEDERVYHDHPEAYAKHNSLKGHVVRIPEEKMTLENFETNFTDLPFIITNPNRSRWPGWSMESLLERFSNVQFRQESVRWPLSFYCEYSLDNCDESPLYLFDCNSDAMKELVNELTVPDCFKKDLFTVFDENDILCRPDHTWLIMGPKNSGSTFHKDPNFTSAWNTAISGRKLWIMLPPYIKPPGIGTDKTESEVTAPVGIAEWTLSGFMQDALNLTKSDQCLVGITYPGECMHVPAGWWHSVINLDNSIAMTGNFIPEPKLPHVLDFVKNKNNQISGFHSLDVKKSLINICKRMNQNTERYQRFQDYIREAKDDNEDCGEMAFVPMPIYDMFLELLEQSEQFNSIDLNNVVDVLTTIEKKNRPAKVRESKTWNQLVSQNGYSFGFSEDD